MGKIGTYQPTKYKNLFSPAGLEAMDANLIGGGLMNLSQFLFRPTMRYYATSTRDIYICSSSTPPGGGVHGMCGYNAAKLALKRLRKMLLISTDAGRFQSLDEP